MRKHEGLIELRLAKEQAEMASSAKSEFIAHMSHDVKTPLSGLIGLADILTHRLQDEESVHLSKSILLAGQQLLQFFDNCLTTVQAENGELTLPNEDFHVKILLENIADLFQPALKEKNLTLAIQHDSHIPERLFGSRIGIYRILLNLIGNAIKFTPKGGIVLRSKLTRSHKQYILIQFSIDDTGIGIAKKKQAIIFERYTRLTPLGKSTSEGSGLGLHIVDTLVKTMGGEIHVNSEEGKGSQFVVTLPLQIPPKSEKGAKTSPRSKHPIVPSLPEGPVNMDISPSILLIEDNPTAQKIAQEILTSIGGRVDIADSGEQALRKFEPGKYQLVFMDIELPDMTSFVVSENLRAAERIHNTLPAVPIIGLSAHMTKAIKKECLKAGMDAVMTKPLTKKQAISIQMNYILGKKLALNPVQKKKSTSSRSCKVELSVIEKGYKKELLELLLNSLSEDCTDIRNAYKSNDWNLLITIVHKIHGGLCYTHTPKLLYAVRTLEISLKNKKFEQFEALYQEVLDAIKSLKKFYVNLE